MKMPAWKGRLARARVERANDPAKASLPMSGRPLEPDIETRILRFLAAAGRPCTAGEIRAYIGGTHVIAADIHRALDLLGRQGAVRSVPAMRHKYGPQPGPAYECLAGPASPYRLHYAKASKKGHP
ncbi:MAG: hypothetical protein ACLQU5_06830 [Isosphaeraceae bacterium]